MSSKKIMESSGAQKGEKRYFARNIKKVDKEIALQQFKTSVIAIDDIKNPDISINTSSKFPLLPGTYL